MTKPKIKPVHGWATVDGDAVIGETFRVNKNNAKTLFEYFRDGSKSPYCMCLVPMVMLTKAEFEGLMVAAAIREGRGK